jgi:pilus assembly protein CpaE
VVLLITQLDLPCMRNVVRLVTSFKETGKLDDRIRIVVNRVGIDTGQISLRKAKETVGRDIYWQIPNDYRVMVEVRNNGIPLVQQAPKAAITQSINQLALALSGKLDQAADSSKSRSWLNLWPVRSSS